MSDQPELEKDPVGPASVGTDALVAELRAVTHDLRSSLTGIMGLTALIERSDDAEASRAWAARVLVACRTMEGRIATINDLAINSSRRPTMGRWT